MPPKSLLKSPPGSELICVCFSPESGHKRRVRLMSANDPKRTFTGIWDVTLCFPTDPAAVNYLQSVLALSVHGYSDKFNVFVGPTYTPWLAAVANMS